MSSHNVNRRVRVIPILISELAIAAAMASGAEMVRGETPQGAIVGWGSQVVEGDPSQGSVNLAVGGGHSPAISRAAIAPTYTITDLGTLGGTYSDAQAINDLGQVVGCVKPQGETNCHGFLWSNDSMSDLGLCGGTSMYPTHINNLGQIVGASDGHGGYYSAFLFDKGVCGILPELAAHTTLAAAINDQGDICGLSNPAPQNRKAVRWVNQVIEQLPTPGQGVANAVNSLRDICGFSGNEQVAVACIWNSSRVRTDLPGLGGGGFASANDISDSGWVVGAATNGAGQQRAFLWTTTGGTVDLGTLGGSTGNALAVNGPGLIVGSAATPTEPEHAFVSDGPSGMHDLNDLVVNKGGWELREARDINNRGQIVGFGTINGETHAFLLNPIVSGLSISPAQLQLPKTSGTAAINVSNSGTGTMPWAAGVIDGQDWLRIRSGGSGVNAGTIYLAYRVNPNASTRTGTLRVSAPNASPAFVDVAVVQAGAGTLTFAPPIPWQRSGYVWGSDWHLCNTGSKCPKANPNCCDEHGPRFFRHVGVDLKGKNGDLVKASAKGVVKLAVKGPSDGFGGFVVLEHDLDGDAATTTDRVTTLYLHVIPQIGEVVSIPVEIA